LLVIWGLRADSTGCSGATNLHATTTNELGTVDLL